MLTCAACGAQSRESARFCEQCGSGFAAACPTCGATPSSASARFCAECGSSLGGGSAVPAQMSAPVAERRVCSVLFADLVGFTPLSESRDPEAVRELLSRYFEAARTVIARYGGTVEKFIGDAVMAVWGAPVATEGDAERAVRAALDLVDAVTVLGAEVGAADLAARAGVVTGEVAVTLGAQGEGMVAGDPVNTAARVQAAAEPGSVLVDDPTHRLTAAAVAFADAGGHVLKGKAEPQHLWRATHVLAMVGGSQRIDGLEAPLIGRGAELRTIKEQFHASVERRTPRLVVVTGPPGVGKSRLGWELEKHIDGLADVVRWHRGRCLSYGDGVAFWALAQAVRQRLDIAEEDAAGVAAAKLAAGLAEIVADEAEREFVAIRLGRLLGVPVSADPDRPMAREELFAGWRIFFERLAATHPVVWLVEDAQYADVALVEFIDHLVDWTRDLPIFVLVLGRPEVNENFPGFGVGRNRTSMTVDPLDDKSIDALIEALVPGIPTGACSAITAHAQGVPLFAMETIRALIDRDVVQPIDGIYRLVGDIGTLTVPDSLHGLLAARLDALPPAVRALAAEAAVLGTTFPADALVSVSEQQEVAVRAGLAELVRREVLQVSADPLSPQRGEYQFAQQLVRQVAYDTLSRRDRKARHLAVAAHLRASFADDGEEVSDAIAQHYRDALEAVPDDADVDAIRHDAVTMTVRAAERASRTGAPVVAADAYAKAAMLVEMTHPIDAATNYERAAEAAERASSYDRSLAYAQHARRLFAEHGESRASARADVAVGIALGAVGRLSEAHEILEASVAELRAAPDADTVRAMRVLAANEIFAGSPRALDRALEALDLAQAVTVDSTELAAVFTCAGIASATTNRRSTAAALHREAARIAALAGARHQQGMGLLNLADCQLMIEPREAAVTAREAVEVCRQIGSRRTLAVGTTNLVSALLVIGDWDEAFDVLDAALYGDGLDEQPHVHGEYAWAAGLRGDVVTARKHLEQMSAVRDSEDHQDQAGIATADAATAYAVGDWASAIGAARRMLLHLDAVGIGSEITFFAWSLGAIAAVEGGDRDAAGEFVGFIDAQPVGHVPPLLRAFVDAVRGAMGRSSTAGSEYERSVDALRRVPAPFNLAYALLWRGQPADVEEARAIAERLGASVLLGRCRDSGGDVVRRTGGAGDGVLPNGDVADVEQSVR